MFRMPCGARPRSSVADARLAGFLRSSGAGDLEEPPGPSRRRSGLVLGRRGRRSRSGVAAPAGPGDGCDAAAPSGPAGGAAVPSTTPRRRPPRAPPRDPSGEAIAWEGEDGEVRRLTNAALRDYVVAAARMFRAARRPPGRSGRDLPSDARRDGRRDARPRPDRRDLHADLLGLRRAGRRRPAARLRGQRPRHRGRLPPARRGRADEGRRRRGRGPGAVGRPGDRGPPARGAARRRRRGIRSATAGGTSPSTPRARPCSTRSSRRPPRPPTPRRPTCSSTPPGTTGKPKGAVHVHGGFPIKAAQDLAHTFDLRAGDALFWFTDLGWMMGPWAISGSLLLGARLVLYEGAPDHPGPDRLWGLVARHRVTHLGLSPTVVRALIPHGTEPVRAHDLSAHSRPGLDRRAVGSRQLVRGTSARSAAGAARSSTTRAGRRSAAGSSAATS